MRPGDAPNSVAAREQIIERLERGDTKGDLPSPIRTASTSVANAVAMKIRKETEIARPVEDVFDYVADPRNELQWHPRVRSMEKTSDGPIGPGTTFRGDYKGSGLIDFTLVEYERPTYMRFTGGNGQVSMEATIGFHRHADRTHGSFDLELAPRGMFTLLMPLLAPIIRRQYAEVMPALKRRLETHEVADARASIGCKSPASG